MKKLIDEGLVHWRTRLLKGASRLLAGGLIFLVLVGLVLGSCHDGGDGLCSAEFGTANRVAYALALVSSALVGPLLVLPVRRDWTWVGGSSVAGFLVAAIVALAGWPFAG